MPQVAQVLDRHGRDPARLVQILRDLRTLPDALTPPVITATAAGLGLPRARVEGVAGFYSFLGTDRAARYTVRFADNITDRMAGSLALRQQLLDAFGLQLGQLSADGLIQVEATACTGLCDQGPALLVNGTAIARLTPARIGAIAALIRGHTPVEEWPRNLTHIETHILRRDVLLDSQLQPGDALRATMLRNPQTMLAEIATSGLRGRGGAGFATAQKWQACRDAAGDQRVIVCNADEGEPGTFKDRVLLSDFADLLIEGMTIAAWTVACQRPMAQQPTLGFVYVRGEYGFLTDHLRQVIARRRAAGLLGANILGQQGFDFDVEVHWGAGAYVCGEESALLESLEGKRGIPRNRPPYPVTHGYLQKPTIINNVETLCAAALIALHGGAWWAALGTPSSKGTKILSVSGDVAQPGLYEYPLGVPVRQVLQDAGADPARVMAVQVGGPSGTLLAPSEFDRRIAFEDVPCAGAVMVFGDQRKIIDVLDNFTHFFAHESCGFCTPCRVGTTIAAKLTGAIVQGFGTTRDLDDLQRVAGILRSASHCGLGSTAALPIQHVLQKFKPALQKLTAGGDLEPSFDLDAALAPAREATARQDAGAHLTSHVADLTGES